MPLPKGIVAYSKIITLPSGYQTLALFDKNHHIIEYRVCEKRDDGTFHCIRGAKYPKERNKLAKKIGINPKTNKPIKKRKK